MERLAEIMDPDEFEKFIGRSFYSWTNQKIFPGVLTDLLIKQTLMRLMKVKGGLIFRGITESTISTFAAGIIAMQNVCHQIEQFCDVTFTTSDEHVDARKTPIERDTSDVEKLYTWFAKNNPFCENDWLVALNFGIVGTSEITCHKAFQVGLEMLSKVLGSTFHSFPHKRKNTICLLADINSSLIVEKKRIAIDPFLLFQHE